MITIYHQLILFVILIGIGINSKTRCECRKWRARNRRTDREELIGVKRYKHIKAEEEK